MHVPSTFMARTSAANILIFICPEELVTEIMTWYISCNILQTWSSIDSTGPNRLNKSVSEIISGGLSDYCLHVMQRHRGVAVFVFSLAIISASDMAQLHR